MIHPRKNGQQQQGKEFVCVGGGDILCHICTLKSKRFSDFLSKVQGEKTLDFLSMLSRFQGIIFHQG